MTIDDRVQLGKFCRSIGRQPTDQFGKIAITPHNFIKYELGGAFGILCMIFASIFGYPELYSIRRGTQTIYSGSNRQL